MTSVALSYGRGQVEVPLAGATFLGILAPKAAPPIERPEEAIRNCLRAPNAGPPLKQAATGGRNAAVLVSARDRVTGSDVFVTVVADELNAAGIPDEAITVYIASGTHQKQTAEDIRGLLGSEGVERLRCVQHDPKDADNLVHLGTTSLGTPIRINRVVHQTDVKILTGRITHHYFAGFSGGRKAIAPGVSSFETITANHRRVMRSDGCGRDVRARAGNLVDNPIHLDMLEIAHQASPTFCLNTVLNVGHEITHVFAGDYLAVHADGSRLVDTLFRVQPSMPADIVVASCGGWPYDISFMQVIKTIVSAEAAVRDGGVLIVLGECERGLEQGFREWFQIPTREELNRAVLASYNLKGHNSYWIREIQARIRLVLVSRLPDSDVEALGCSPARSASDAMRIARDLVGGAPSIAAVPYGNVTNIARLQDG